jgi:hypothetical protein
MGELSQGTLPSGTGSEDRLDSWKEIAAYLNRDVTTVQRWEKREGMPVYRHQHDRMGSVYASRTELDAWVRRRSPRGRENGNDAPSPNPPVPSKHSAMYFALPIILTVIVGGLLFLWREVFRTSREPRVVRFTQLTNDGQAKTGPMATDGSRVYFNQRSPGSRNFVAQVSVRGGEAIPLAVSMKQPRFLDINGEGTETLLANAEDYENSSLWVQPVAGGSSRHVGTVPAENSYFANFGADGTSIIYGNRHDVNMMSRDGSTVRKLLTVESIPFFFQLSPNARVLRFAQVDLQSGMATIFEAAADGSGLHKMFGGCCGKWTPDARFFVFQQGNGRRTDFWALPEERGFWRPKKDVKPIQLTAGPLDFQFPVPSKDGKEVFALGISRRAELLRYDLPSRKFVPYLPGISADSLSFSPDGKWITYTSYSDGMLWRSKTDGSERLQLTFPPLQVFLPRWSPDGKQIAFAAELPGGVWNIYIVSSEGGTPQRILPSNESQIDANWSPDGKSLTFASDGVPNKWIYIIDLKSRRVSTLPGSLGLYSPRWSPDGKYIAAIKAEHPQTLNLFDFSTQKWTEVFSYETGYENWSHDSKYLYLERVTASDGSFSLQRLRLADRKVEELIDLNKVVRPADWGETANWLGIAPDDSPLVFRDTSTQEIYALEMDWQ